MEWFKSRYLASNAAPVIIHPEKTLGQGASRVEEMRVIDVSGLDKLRKNISSFAEQITNPKVANNVGEIAKRLAQFGLQGEKFVETFSVTVKI